ncbi:hypothetical protein J2741_001504 [Methanolinea mesophila]|uniref:hypothetical protein n=1 Tax=Methanolinea mesophila TaxID=547055 RepID=UPI001AE10364|nr:hypothetical protein [Methanolinea mesophila]MBP1928957.1 hypothetical protein [Methanolinea mesophila]
MLCTAAAFADTGVPQVPETQGFSTSTAMSALGTVTETDSIVNVIASQELEGISPLIEGESVYTSTYAENTIADQGLVTYAKQMTTDTAGVATTNLFNVHAEKVVEFVGTDTGRMISDENSVLDGAGVSVWDRVLMICPFASPDQFSMNPPFCNIVEEGSSVDLTLGSLATGTSQRYIMEVSDAGTVYDYPVSDPGVESGYRITLTGFGDIPAAGSAEAFLDAHIQEGRVMTGIPPVAPKAEDIVYSELTTVSGDITLFQKVMGYTSTITSPGVLNF